MLLSMYVSGLRMPGHAHRLWAWAVWLWQPKQFLLIPQVEDSGQALCCQMRINRPLSAFINSLLSSILSYLTLSFFLLQEKTYTSKGVAGGLRQKGTVNSTFAVAPEVWGANGTRTSPNGRDV